MTNKVFLNKKGFIEQRYLGNQNFQSVMRAFGEVMLLSDELKGTVKKTRVLVNVVDIGTITADALLAAADALNSFRESKVAVFGGKKLVNDLANLVIAAVGREKSVMVFDTKKEAISWLSNK